jgi:hypothetical protein
MGGRFEAAQPAFSFPGGLMRVLGTVVEPLVLAVLHRPEMLWQLG